MYEIKYLYIQTARLLFYVYQVSVDGLVFGRTGHYMLLICSTQLYNKLKFSALWTIFCRYILFIRSLYSDGGVFICLGL